MSSFFTMSAHHSVCFFRSHKMCTTSPRILYAFSANIPTNGRPVLRKHSILLLFIPFSLSSFMVLQTFLVWQIRTFKCIGRLMSRIKEEVEKAWINLTVGDMCDSTFDDKLSNALVGVLLNAWLFRSMDEPTILLNIKIIHHRCKREKPDDWNEMKQKSSVRMCAAYVCTQTYHFTFLSFFVGNSDAA